MTSKLFKIALFAVALALFVFMFGGLATTSISAESPQSGPPPTVALPTPAVTRTPSSRAPNSGSAPLRPSVPTAAPTATIAVRAAGPRTAGPPGGGWYTGQSIMNSGSTSTEVDVTVYNSATTNSYVYTHTLTGGASWTFMSSDVPGVPSTYTGSAMVSSGQPINAIVNVTNMPSGSLGTTGGTAAEQYGGWDGTRVGQSVSFPLVKYGFGNKTSALYVQNAGGSAVPFHAVFQMGPGLTGPFTTYTYDSPTSLNPGQMAVIDAGVAGVPTGRIGSVTVSASQNLAGTFMEFETSTSPALILQAANGFGPNDADSTFYFPIFKNNFGGRSTGIQVQNVSGGNINVTMYFYGSQGPCAGITYSDTTTGANIPSGQSRTFLNPSSVPSGCLGSAKAVATGGNIVGVVNESFIPCGSGCVQRSTTYDGFPAKLATAHLVAPLYKQQFGCKWTGLQIQNLNTSSSALATAVFNVNGTNYTLTNISVPKNGSTLLLNVSSSIPTGSSWSGAALPNGSLASVSVTANQNIVAIANESVMPANNFPSCSTVNQNTKNYEAFNVTP